MQVDVSFTVSYYFVDLQSVVVFDNVAFLQINAALIKFYL